jgi:tripartite-type tricarboxylate transporter receptor subunit TctC
LRARAISCSSGKFLTEYYGSAAGKSSAGAMHYNDCMPARIHFTALIALAALCTADAGAQMFPQRSIRIVVPFAPGGANDNAARVVAQKYNEAFTQAVVVDNRPGGATNVGTEIVARAPPDGHTLLVTNSSLATNLSLYKSLPYDARRDLAPVTLIFTTPLVLVTHPSLPVKSVRDLIALAKARPGQLTFGSAGIASPAHICGELLNMLAGIRTVHIPYKGGTQALADLLGGQITIAFTGGPATMELMRAGRLRILATTGPKRFTVTPDIPTIAESGVPGYDLVGWVALFATGGTPPEIIARLNAEALRGLTQPDAKKRIEDTGAEVNTSTPQELAAFLAKEIDKYANLIRVANIRPE